MTLNLYEELSRINLTDKSNRYEVCRYALIKCYLDWVEFHKPYKNIQPYQTWHHAFRDMISVGIFMREQLTYKQMESAYDWILDIVPEEVKSSGHFGWNTKGMLRMIGVKDDSS